MQKKTDQRKHARQKSKFNVEFSLDDSPPLHATGTNISLGGTWLNFSGHKPEIGDEGKLHARIGDLHLYMMARVVRKDSTGIGLSFIDMGIETYHSLNVMLQRNMHEQASQNAMAYKVETSALL
ncbi:MAG: PilZ domain-containing protein [Mariprofundaceae bacterium]